MFIEQESVAQGGLASYGVSYFAIGQTLSQVRPPNSLGRQPGDLPIEQFDRLYFVINLKTARALGLTIPPCSCSGRIR